MTDCKTQGCISPASIVYVVCVLYCTCEVLKCWIQSEDSDIHHLDPNICVSASTPQVVQQAHNACLKIVVVHREFSLMPGLAGGNAPIIALCLKVGRRMSADVVVNEVPQAISNVRRICILVYIAVDISICAHDRKDILFDAGQENGVCIKSAKIIKLLDRWLLKNL